MKRDFDAEARALPEHDFDRLMHGYMMRTFQPLFGTTVSALELGCYHGEFTARIYEEFPDVSVVEASRECIEAARGKLPLVEFIHSTFEAAEIERRFDAVFLIHTLEHVEDPVRLLARCREWLAPGGRLFVAVPNAHAASRRIAVKMGILARPEAVTAAEAQHGHKRTYSQRELQIQLSLARLRLCASGGIMFKPLANFQLDAALKAGIIDLRFLEGCFALGQEFPELCSSIYAVCEAGT